MCMNVCEFETGSPYAKLLLLLLRLCMLLVFTSKATL